MASIGLPGLCGFIGEFLVLLGAFRSSPWTAVVAATGVILGAVYMLWMYRRVFFGPILSEKNRKLPDLSLRELVVILPLVIGMVALGVRPAPLLDRMETAVQGHLEMIGFEEVVQEESEGMEAPAVSATHSASQDEEEEEE